MPRSRRRLDQTIAALRDRYGPEIVQRASSLARPTLPPHVGTGFAELDELTGCGGIPLGSLTLLSGASTSGKVTLAYKVLMETQRAYPKGLVALLDLGESADPDYLHRCGLGLERLMLVRPQSLAETVDVLLDLLSEREVVLTVLDSLPHLLTDRRQARRFGDHLAQVNRLLRQQRTGLLCLDEPHPPWLRWLGWHATHETEQWAALHLDLKREEWLYTHGELSGYRATARLVKSRWNRSGGSAPVEFHFNGTVQAGRTW